MKTPITIVVDLDDYIGDYEFNGDLFRSDILNYINRELANMIIKTLKKEDFEDRIEKELDNLDFQILLRDFLNDNKELVIKEISALIERKEEIYKNIDIFRRKNRL